MDAETQAGVMLRQHLRLGRGQHTVQSAQHGERQDDLAVVGLLVIAAQQIGDGPDEGGEVLLVHGSINQDQSALAGLSRNGTVMSPWAIG